MYSLGISLVVIVVCGIASCIIFGVPRLPVRPCDERPPAMYGHFCLVPRVSVHDRYYCSIIALSLANKTRLVSAPSVANSLIKQLTRHTGLTYYKHYHITFTIIIMTPVINGSPQTEKQQNTNVVISGMMPTSAHSQILL